MKISSIIACGKPAISFEVFPPKKRTDLAEAESREAMNRTKDVVAQIAAERPAFISVTYGAAGGSTGANTCELARFVQETCGVPALAHLTCITSDRDKIADELKSFRDAGIENVLCLRGDRPVEAPGRENTARTVEAPGRENTARTVEAPGRENTARTNGAADGEFVRAVLSRPDPFAHAVDLIRALRPSTFCLGGACYPEKHPECEHLEDDIAHLKEKVDAGLDFLTTQMFFDNNVYFHYLARLRNAGVTTPVIAGVMPVTNGRQIKRICDLSGTSLPPRFRAIVDRFGDSPVAMMDAGVAYATEQIIDLFANGVTNIHVYTMNKPEVASRIMKNLHGILSD